MNHYLIYVRGIIINPIKPYSVYNCTVKIDSDEYTDKLLEEAKTIAKPFITDVTNTEVYLKSELICMNDENSEIVLPTPYALEHFIYYDKFIKSYIISNYSEPEYSILNYLIPDRRIDLYVIGNQKEFLNEEYVSLVKSNFERIYHCDNIQVGNFNFKKDNSLDIDFLKEMMVDKNNPYVIILPSVMDIDEIEKFVDIITENKNINLFIKGKNEYYKIIPSSREIIFKKVSMR